MIYRKEYKPEKLFDSNIEGLADVSAIVIRMCSLVDQSASSVSVKYQNLSCINHCQFFTGSAPGVAEWYCPLNW